MARKISGQKAGAPDTVSPEHLVQEISRRAHELFLKRGTMPGSELSDWLEAEREVKAKYGIKG